MTSLTQLLFVHLWSIYYSTEGIHSILFVFMSFKARSQSVCHLYTLVAAVVLLMLSGSSRCFFSGTNSPLPLIITEPYAAHTEQESNTTGWRYRTCKMYNVHAINWGKIKINKCSYRGIEHAVWITDSSALGG